MKLYALKIEDWELGLGLSVGLHLNLVLNYWIMKDEILVNMDLTMLGDNFFSQTHFVWFVGWGTCHSMHKVK